MEVIRYARALLPMAAIALLGAPGGGRPLVVGSADPPWNPPACRATLDSRGPTAGVAWFRMDATLDAGGTLTGQRLSVGLVGGRTRQIALPPESFASGPVGGIVLVGDDDGTRSRLRAVDPAASCASTVAVESAVIRSGILDQALGAVVRAPRRPAHARGPRRLAAFDPRRNGRAGPAGAGAGHPPRPDLRDGPAMGVRRAPRGRLVRRARVSHAGRRPGDRDGGRDGRHGTRRRRPGFARDRLRRVPRLPVRAARRRSGDDRDPADRAKPTARPRIGGPALVFRHGGHLVVLDTHTGAGGDVAGIRRLRAGPSAVRPRGPGSTPPGAWCRSRPSAGRSTRRPLVASTPPRPPSSPSR